jgi:DNA mismatch repair protein MutL
MNVWVNPSVVDVNVHPQKLEVRFSDGGPIFRAVSRAMAIILTEMPWLEGGGFHQARTEEAVVSFFRREANSTDASSEPSKGSAGFWGRGVTPTRIGTSSMQPSADGVPGGRGHLLIGNQFHLSESASGIRIVDLKEAALQWSGVSYNNALQQGEVPKHSLLFPEVLELSADLALFCEAHWESLGKLGFEVEPVGPKRFALRTIPLAYSGAEPVGLAHACLAQLASLRFDGRLSENQQEELEKACRGGAEFPLDGGLNPDVLQGLLEWASAQEACSGISKEISPGELKRLLA